MNAPTAQSESTSSSSTTRAPPNFRLQSKNFSITFPQCAVSKKDALERILRLCPSPKGVIVCQEKHADGEPHLHIGLFLNDRLRTRDPNYFDCIAQKHGNYQSTRVPAAWVEYCRKEDSSPEIYGTLPTPRSKASTSSKATEIAEMINSGSTLDQVQEMQPGYFLLHKRKIEDYAAFIAQKQQRLSIKKLKMPLPYTGQDPDTQSICDWLNTNLFQSRSFKSKQLLISGPANSLKTSLMEKLSTYVRIYHPPIIEAFFDSYSDDDYDLVFFDEFRGQQTCQWMNLFLQGSQMSIRKKGTQAMKRKNLPCVICSNFSVENIYKDPINQATFAARVLEINLKKPIDLDKIEFAEQ